jgi:hypothetical protein
LSSKYHRKSRGTRLSCFPSSAEESVSSKNPLKKCLDLIISVYIFIGSILVGGNWPKIVAGTLIGVVGIGYAALEFVPSIEPPANMR